MLTTQLEAGRFPEGLYGRAWLTGRSLIDAVGWEHVRLLATSFDARGGPDVAEWIHSHRPAMRVKAVDVVGIPSSAWV